MSFSCHGHRGGGQGEHLQGTVGFEKDWQEGPAKARLVIPYSGEDHSFLCFLAAQVFPCLPRPAEFYLPPSLPAPGSQQRSGMDQNLAPATQRAILTT